jgi:hypothetical protein
MVDQALQIAWHLIKLDPDAFLRRLFVIMLEDVSLHMSLSVIVWLTSAISKGYKLQSKHISWLLGVTRHLCQEPKKTYIEYCHYEQYDIPTLISQLNQSDLSELNKDIIYSILFRFSYGGMPPDLNMFYWFAINLLNRNIETSTAHLESIDTDTIQPIKICDILVNCADFHCFPQLIQMIHQQFPEVAEDNIRHAIWECNSKKNTRFHDTIDPFLSDIWAKIRPIARRIQRNLIQYNH